MPKDEDTANEESGEREQDTRVPRSSALDRLDQKRLAVKLRLYGEQIMRESEDVLICDEQDELIGEAAAQLFDAAAATWPGDEMPRLDEIRKGEWDDEPDREFPTE